MLDKRKPYKIIFLYSPGFLQNDEIRLIKLQPNALAVLSITPAIEVDVIKKGIKAGDIVKETAPIIGGGGGGRPQIAQAGGKKPQKIDDALKKATELIKEKLASA